MLRFGEDKTKRNFKSNNIAYRDPRKIPTRLPTSIIKSKLLPNPTLLFRDPKNEQTNQTFKKIMQELQNETTEISEKYWQIARDITTKYRAAEKLMISKIGVRHDQCKNEDYHERHCKQMSLKLGQDLACQIANGLFESEIMTQYIDSLRAFLPSIDTSPDFNSRSKCFYFILSGRTRKAESKTENLEILIDDCDYIGQGEEYRPIQHFSYAKECFANLNKTSKNIETNPETYTEHNAIRSNKTLGSHIANALKAGDRCYYMKILKNQNPLWVRLLEASAIHVFAGEAKWDLANLAAGQSIPLSVRIYLPFIYDENYHRMMAFYSLAMAQSAKHHEVTTHMNFKMEATNEKTNENLKIQNEKTNESLKIQNEKTNENLKIQNLRKKMYLPRSTLSKSLIYGDKDISEMHLDALLRKLETYDGFVKDQCKTKVLTLCYYTTVLLNINNITSTKITLKLDVPSAVIKKQERTEQSTYTIIEKIYDVFLEHGQKILEIEEIRNLLDNEEYGIPYHKSESISCKYLIKMTVTTCFPSVLMQVHRQGQYILRSVGESLGWKEVSLPSDPICESLMCGYEKYYSMSMPMFADFLLETDPEFYKYLTRNNEKMNQVSKDHPNFSSLYLANVIQKMVNRGDIVEELEYFGPDREKYCRLPTDPPMKYSALRKIGGINRKYSKKRILLDYLFDNGDSRGTKLLALFPTKKNRKKIARGPIAPTLRQESVFKTIIYKEETADCKFGLSDTFLKREKQLNEMAFELKKTQLSYKEHREFKYSIQSSKLSFGSSARNHAILSGKLPVLEKYNPNSRSTEEINREYRVAVTLSEITLAKAKALWETLAKERKDEKKARMAAEDDWKSGKSRNTKKHIERAPDKVSPTKKEIMGNPEKFVQTGEKRNIFEIMMANSAKRSKNAF